MDPPFLRSLWPPLSWDLVAVRSGQCFPQDPLSGFGGGTRIAPLCLPLLTAPHLALCPPTCPPTMARSRLFGRLGAAWGLQLSWADVVGWGRMGARGGPARLAAPTSWCRLGAPLTGEGGGKWGAWDEAGLSREGASEAGSFWEGGELRTRLPGSSAPPPPPPALPRGGRRGGRPPPCLEQASASLRAMKSGEGLGFVLGGSTQPPSSCSRAAWQCAPRACLAGGLLSPPSGLRSDLLGQQLGALPGLGSSLGPLAGGGMRRGLLRVCVCWGAGAGGSTALHNRAAWNTVPRGRAQGALCRGLSESPSRLGKQG